MLLLLREVRLNERQTNFVSAVTHELKTPVASLRLYLDTLQLRDLPESRREDFYRTMRQDLDRLHATINNVLNAAMYTDRPVVDPQPLDFAQAGAPRHRADPHAPPAAAGGRRATRAPSELAPAGRRRRPGDRGR